MRWPTVSRDPKRAKIASRLITPFQKLVFAAAVQSLDQRGNPLRFNNFATNLRELGRIMLDGLAPDNNIKKCEWYVPAINDKGKETVTRAQRVKYAVQAGLTDDFVKNTLKIDVAPTVRKYTKLIEHLSDFTHVTEKVFGIKRSVEDQYVRDALTSFILVFQTIDDCRGRV